MKTNSSSRSALALLAAGLLVTVGASGQNAYWWTGASGVNTNWSNYANWSLGAFGAAASAGYFPGAFSDTADAVTFTNTASVATSNTVNNVVDTSTTLASLLYRNPYPNWQVTAIPAGITLTVGTLTVGGQLAASVTNLVSLTGAGTLVVNGGLVVGNSKAASVSGADSGTTLDLSRLSNFVFNAAGSKLIVGLNGAATNNNAQRTAANMNFAQSNTVTAAVVDLNNPPDGDQGAATGTVNLGGATNSFQVGALNVAGGRNTGTLKFPGATGGLNLTGLAGPGSRANLQVLSRTGTATGNTASGTVTFNGHPVTLLLDTLLVCTNGNYGGSGRDTATGTVSFDTGTLDATTINLSGTSVDYNVSGASTNYSHISTGILNVGPNATLIAGSGGLIMANQLISSADNGAYNTVAGSVTTFIPSGFLNITNGTVICSNSIVAQANANGGYSYITNYNGTLAMQAPGFNSPQYGLPFGIGSPQFPITSMALSNTVLGLAVFNANSNSAVVSATALSELGTSDTINITSLPLLTSYPVTNTLVTWGNTLTPAFVLGSMPTNPYGVGGNTHYSGYLTTDAQDVYLVVTNGPTAYHLPPFIQQQPQPVTLIPGGRATFTVQTYFDPTLAYQWSLGGYPVPGATNSWLIVTNVCLANAGSYSVTITNVYGQTTSAGALLTVLNAGGFASEAGRATGLAGAGPVAYWRFNETGGPTAYDFLGAYNGTNFNLVFGTNGPNPASSPVAFLNLESTNLAYEFPNGNSVVCAPSSLVINTNGFSAAAWINNTNTVSALYLILAQGLATWFLDVNGSTVDFGVDQSVYLTGNTPVCDGNWHQVVGVYDTTNIYIYVDGVLDNHTADPNGMNEMNSNSPPITIGAYDPAGYDAFHGGLDEVMVFNRALSAAEVNTLYTNATLVSAPPPVPPAPGLNAGGITRPAGVPTFTFNTSAGFLYRLIYKNSLTDPTWLPVIDGVNYPLPGGWSAASAGGSMTIADHNATGQPQRFYKVEAVTPP